MIPENLFAEPARCSGEELTRKIAQGRNVRIEQIVSSGQSSPPGFWYDQSQAEWVVVLKGAARLIFADEETPLELVAGDHVLIAPHRRHRVDWTTPEMATVWLAVYFDDESAA